MFLKILAPKFNAWSTLLFAGIPQCFQRDQQAAPLSTG